MPLVEQMVEEGLVVLSDVDIIKYSHRALEIDRRCNGRCTASA